MTATGKLYEFWVQCPEPGCGKKQKMGSNNPGKARRRCVFCGRSFDIRGRMVV